MQGAFTEKSQGVSRGHFGESVSMEVTWGGFKRSALLSNDRSGKRWNAIGKTWTLQLARPSRYVSEPDPTYNYTLTFQPTGFLVSGSLLGQALAFPEDVEDDSWIGTLHCDGHIPTLHRRRAPCGGLLRPLPPRRGSS